MSPNEACRELLSIRKHIEDGHVTHLSCGGKADKQTEKDIEAYSIAISALEKQIPKKPIEDGYYDEPCVCPNCGSNVINEVDNDYQFEYCYHCGQSLDWSVDNA